jgi:hypothetical protein
MGSSSSLGCTAVAVVVVVHVDEVQGGVGLVVGIQEGVLVLVLVRIGPVTFLPHQYM